MRTLKSTFILFLSLSCAQGIAIGQTNTSRNLLSAFEFRNLGAFRAGAWMSSIAVPESPLNKYEYTFYVAARNGGVWKTENNGTTFVPIFDRYGVNSIGCVTVAPSDPEIVWVGTGDSYSARSSYAGNGVYKSTDGGKTFQLVGLGDTHHISKIIIHPRNPDVVYVAALGHVYSPNAERGVFKTEDGGKTWKKVLLASDNTGVIDLSIHPNNPEILFAATYQKYRYPWHFEAGGKESGLFKTIDGGKTWKKLTRGFPAGTLGRIGVDLCRAKPDIVYALVENLNPKDTVKELKTEGMMGAYRDSYYDQLKGGEMYRSGDGGETWTKVSAAKFNLSSKAAYSFNLTYVDPFDSNRIYVLSDNIHVSADGGVTWTGFERDEKEPPFPNVFGDYRTFWIDPHDPRHIILGSDGGLYVSYDMGKTAEHLYNIPVQEVYAVASDVETPYNIYCGLQDHEAWRGPSSSWKGEITLEDWDLVGISDGMYCVPDTASGRWFYTTGQFGLHQRVDFWNGQRANIMPERAKGEIPYRYTWTTPIVISPHKSSTIFTGAEVLLRSRDRGDHWEQISPDLTTNDPKKKNGRGHIQFCTITTIAESPLEQGRIWIGTDDGKVQVTSNEGKTWLDCTGALRQAGAPPDFWVTRVVASRYNPSRAYVTTSGHAFDDFRPAVLRTDDMGKSWKLISSNLPQEPVNVVWESDQNPDVFFLGTNGGAYVSINAGKSWVKFPGIPPVPVKDLVVQSRERDLIIGTFGRGCFVAHIGPLESITEATLENESVLFAVKSKPQRNFSEQAWWGNRDLMGDKHLRTPNDPNGFEVFYYLKAKPENGDMLEIVNASDSLVASFDVTKEAGLHRQVWNFDEAKLGIYTIKLIAGGKVHRTTASILPALLYPLGNRAMPQKKVN